jgi:hypothetical protein
MAKRKQATKTPAPAPAPEPDHDADGNRYERELIENCIIAGSSLAAIQAAYEHDPDGDYVHAEKFSERFARSQEKAFEAVAKADARTVAGLKAKGLLVAAMIHTERFGRTHHKASLEGVRVELVQSFALDVVHMMRVLAEAPGAVIGVKH